MNKTKYTIRNDNSIYVLDFGDGRVIEVSGENLHNVMWSYYLADFEVEDELLR
jgi:predicted Ser/Thr protein kinase